MDYIKLLELGMKPCQREKIGKTLFIKRHKGDILLISFVGEFTFFLGLQVKQKKHGTFISQDKYVDEILKKFRFIEVKTVSTPMETQKPLLKDEDGEDVDVHMYRSMIGSLMYLTSSRPDIMFVVCACATPIEIQKPLLKDEDGEEVDVHMYRSMIGSLMYLTSSRPDIIFVVCACARYQVYPKVSHLYAVKKMFSDYVGTSLDMKSTIGGCQFLGCKLISWQCKKQTVVANSTTKAEYVAAWTSSLDSKSTT
uniref:Reverse transcriptase Ty1/copia-type domain-containing protein n=1 Tax=Tanacetum cinerariifolium TaxID=118510 RepID=A0A699HR61_TANCI|nr:hypothetical protein [Tanacetum cinerariifolium]